MNNLRGVRKLVNRYTPASVGGGHGVAAIERLGDQATCPEEDFREIDGAEAQRARKEELQAGMSEIEVGCNQGN